MSTLDPHKTHTHNSDHTEDQSSEQEPGHEGHGAHSRWMMIACCIPMLVIAGLLVASGAGAGFLVVALICTAMMAMMMIGMSGGSGKDGGGQ